MKENLIRDFLTFFRKIFKTIFLFFVLGVLFGILYDKFKKPYYETTAIATSGLSYFEGVVQPDNFTNPIIDQKEIINIINSLSPIIESRDHELLASKLELEYDLAKEIVFGLGEEENPSQNNLSSSALDSILDQSGANQASKNIREEIVVINEELLSSTKGVFSGEKYLSEEEILDAVKESQRIRENIFNDKSLLEGETPITTRPKKRNSLFGKLF